MRLDSAIHCVGFTDPAVLGVLAFSVVAAGLVWWGLIVLGTRLRDPWRRRIYLPVTWGIVVLLLLVGPGLTLHLAYPFLHPRTMVCTAFVSPAFLVLPLLLPAFSVVRAVLRRRHTDRPPDHA